MNAGYHITSLAELDQKWSPKMRAIDSLTQLGEVFIRMKCITENFKMFNLKTKLLKVAKATFLYS